MIHGGYATDCGHGVVVAALKLSGFADENIEDDEHALS